MRLIGTLLHVFLFATISGAVNYVFDELLFSKDTWADWKLENPLADMNPSDLLPKAKERFSGYDGAEFNSLDGPKARVSPGQKTAITGDGPDIDPLDDESLVERASKAAQCTTCHVLVAVVWHRLVAQLLSGETVTRDSIEELLQDACEKDAVDVMLRKHTILKMESSGGVASLTFFVVRERKVGGRGPAATEAEEGAVEMSCKGLVEEHGSDLTDVLLTQLANYRREALRLLVKHDRDGGNRQDQAAAATDTEAVAAEPAAETSGGGGDGSGSRGQLPRLGGGGLRAPAADDDDDYVDPDDLDEKGEVMPGARGRGLATKAGAQQPAKTAAAAAPRVRGLVIKVNPDEPKCEDQHHLCSSWAAAGECSKNPNYMIGTDKHGGSCRKSCGVCHPDDLLSSSPKLSAELDSVSSALLLAVKNLGCGAGGPCLSGVSGVAMGSGLLKQQATQKMMTQIVSSEGLEGGRKELLQGMKEFPGGFILGKPWWGRPEVQSVPPALRKPLPVSPDSAGTGTEASGSGSGPESSSGSRSGGSSLASPSHGEVDRVLAPVLAHRVMSIPSDFFTYEYLYKNHTRHYHETPNGDITEDWLLGRFTRESVSLMSSNTGEVAGLEELDLLPGSSHAQLLKSHTWPYVKQVYAGGDECVLAGGRRVVRRVEARIACSPDKHIYMLVREPDFCTYTFVIFVPQLCELDYYKPRPKATAGGYTKETAAVGAAGASRTEESASEGGRKRRRMAGGGRA